MSKVECSVVILNYNGKEFLERLLNSVSKQDFPREKYEIVFVDNGSTDSSVSFVKERFPSVRVLMLPRNMGIGYGLNCGAKMAKGEFICFLGSDQEIPHNYVSTLTDTIKHHRKSIVVCKVKSFNGSIQWAGGKIDKAIPITIGFRDIDRYDGEYETLWATSGAMIIRKNDFLEIGGFLETIPVAEDVEFSLRARKYGFKVIFTGKTFTYHERRGTLKKFPEHKQLSDMIQSRHMMAKRYFSTKDQVDLFLRNLIWALARLSKLKVKEGKAILEGMLRGVC